MQTYRTRALRASWVARLRIRWAVHTAPGSAPQASSAPLPPQSPHSRALLALFARRGRPCRWHAPLAPTQAPSTSRRKRSAPSAQREATAAQDPQSPRSARRAHMQPTRAWMSVKVVLPAPSNQSVGRVSANHARMVTTVTPELRCLYPAQQAHTEGTPTAAASTTVLNVRLVTTATARARPRRRAQQEGTATSLGSSARSAVALALRATSAEKAPSPRLTPAARPAQTTPHPVAPALPLACHAAPGTYAPANGTENCLTCDPGTFQGAVGQTSCDVCSVGSYCPRGATQPLLCEAGRFGDSAGLTNSTCTGPCSPGYYCEAGSQEPTRGACPPGSANPFYGAQSAESCVPCPVGQAANTSASTACTPCSAGTYAPSQGRRQCLPCPRQTAATEGSAQCDLCAEGYYKLDEDATTENSCKACPEGAICSIGTKLSTLVLKAGYWRLTPRALILTKCEDPNGVERCRGGESKVVEGNGYCAPFLHGPECKGCSEGSYYDAAQGRCRDCKIAWTLMACLTTVLLIFVAILAAATKLINPNTKLHPRRKMLKKLQRNLRSLALALSSVGAMAKLKILLAFLQISQAFSTVYAVHFPSTLTSWTWVRDVAPWASETSSLAAD